MEVKRDRNMFSVLASAAGSLLDSVVYRREERRGLVESGDEPVRGLLDHLSDALLVYDSEGRVVETNRRACEMLGYGRDELLRLSARDIREASESFADLREAPEADAPVVWEEVYRRKDGTTFPVEVSLRRAETSGRNLVTLVREPALRGESYKALQDSEARLAAAQRIAHFGSWVYDYDRDEAYWSGELYRIFGHEPGSFVPTYRTFLRAVHPEDKRAVRRSVRQAFDGREECSVDYRVVRPGGEVRCVHSNYEVIRDGDGRPLRQIGTVHDVTDQRLAESKLSWLASFPENNPSPTLEADLYGNVTYANPAAEKVFPDLRVAGADHCIMEAFGLGGGRGARGGYQEIRVGDSFYHLELSAAPGAGTDGGRVRIYATNITERRRLEEQLSHQAFHDALTGLANRALFVDRLEQALSRRGDQRPGESAAVLFLDLDNFKDINDSLGHEAGDRLLVAVGERLSSVVRPADIVARLGGDEFTVLVEDLGSPAGASLVAGRVMDGFKAPFSVSGRKVSITASVGIVPNLRSYQSARELLRAADFAMYRAKKSGKACGVVCEQPEPA